MKFIAIRTEQTFDLSSFIGFIRELVLIGSILYDRCTEVAGESFVYFLVESNHFSHSSSLLDYIDILPVPHIVFLDDMPFVSLRVSSSFPLYYVERRMLVGFLLDLVRFHSMLVVSFHHS
jgi:hypothetical protein